MAFQTLSAPLPETLASPSETARFELGAYFGPSETPRVNVTPEMGDSYRIERKDGLLCVSGGETGVLYGAYSLLFASAAGSKLPEQTQTPYYPLRVLSCWDNMDGSVERGYSGRSIWFEGGRLCYEPGRIRQLGRMLASAGINVLCLNNVNVHYPAQELMLGMLPELAAFAGLLRPFGVRLMLSAIMFHGEHIHNPCTLHRFPLWGEDPGKL